MPYNNRYVNNINSEYTEAIDRIECLINVKSTTKVILCGDWNCDFS